MLKFLRLARAPRLFVGISSFSRLHHKQLALMPVVEFLVTGWIGTFGEHDSVPYLIDQWRPPKLALLPQLLRNLGAGAIEKMLIIASEWLPRANIVLDEKPVTARLEILTPRLSVR